MPPSTFSEALTSYREATGMTQTQLATRAGLSLSSLNRWEKGGSLPRREHAETLDRVLNADGKLLARFDESRDGVALPPWFRDLASIESEARTVDVVAPVLVPGYLQSPRYARMLFRAARPWDSDDDIDRLTQLRTQRLEQLPGLRVRAVFPETALSSPTLPDDVRQEQAAGILRWVRTGRVTTHVIPADTLLLVPTAPVMIFTLRDGSTVATCDYAAGSVVTTSPEHPRLLAAVTTALATALPAAPSRSLLERLTS